MDVRVGDVLLMKKPHPCGEHSFTVGRVGMDFRIRCNGCGHEVMVPRAKVEKSIRKIFRDGAEVEKTRRKSASAQSARPERQEKPDV